MSGFGYVCLGERTEKKGSDLNLISSTEAGEWRILSNDCVLATSMRELKCLGDGFCSDNRKRNAQS